MAYTLKQFDTAQEVVDYLNNVIQSKPLGAKVTGLHGLTLILNPAGTPRTVTFADASGAGLTPTEIITQIADTHSELEGVAAIRNYRHGTPPTYFLTFTEDGDVVDKDGTANAVFGFNTAADSTVGTSAVALSDIASLTTDEGGNKFTIVHQ